MSYGGLDRQCCKLCVQLKMQVCMKSGMNMQGVGRSVGGGLEMQIWSTWMHDSAERQLYNQVLSSCELQALASAEAW